MNPNTNHLAYLGVERFPAEEELSAQARPAGQLAIGPVFLGDQIPTWTEAKVYNDGPPVAMTEEQLKRVCGDNNLVYGLDTWQKLRAMPTDRLLFSASQPGVPEQLYLNKLANVIRENYNSTKTQGWLNAGEQTMYTLNLLTDALVPAAANNLPEVSVPAKRLEEVDNRLMADPEHIEEFLDAMGLTMRHGVVADTIKRIAREAAAKRYFKMLDALPLGQYCADESIVEVAPHKDRGYKDIAGKAMGLSGLARALRDESVLAAANVLPRTHYALLSYVRALQNQHGVIEDVYEAPPKHPAVSERYKPQILDREVLKQGEVSGDLIDFYSYFDNIPRWPKHLGRYSLGKMQYVQDKVKQSLATGMYTPVTSLFRQEASSDGVTDRLYFSRADNLSFLKDYFLGDKKPEDVVTSEYAIGILLQFDMELGPIEAELPPINTPFIGDLDITFRLQDALNYAAQLGIEVDQTNAEASLRNFQDNKYHEPQEEWVYLERGKEWLCSLPVALRGSEIYALSRYLKLVHNKQIELLSNVGPWT